MEYLRAGWRFGQPPGVGADGQPYSDITPAEGQTLFEAIEQSEVPESETYILSRSQYCFSVLNIFPYNSGHVMVLPKRGVASIDDLTDDEHIDLWTLVRQGSRAVKAALFPDGLNIGVNEGQAGGGSIPDHLHVHIVPRWRTDTNFITTVGEARVLPVTLQTCWERIRANWPQ